jgi:exodeoxyribonuclease VII small subunit
MSEATFELALAELEQVVRELEEGQLGLDEALARYERGVALVRQCQGRLREAELRILALVGVEGEEPITEPFAHEATARNGSGKKKRG